MLKFSDPKKAEAWVNLEKFSAQGPCDISAFPSEGGMELRLAYAAPSGATLKNLSYKTDSDWIIDHWIEAGAPGKARVAKVSKKHGKASKPTVEKKISSNNGMNPLVKFSEKVIDLYQDQEQWNKILGKLGQAYSFESPELDRFRISVSERKESFDKKPRSQRPLVPPLLALPMLDAELTFVEQAFELARFEKKNILKPNDPRAEVAVEGLNYVRKLYVEKNWLKLREAMSVIERGSIKDLVPADTASWWAVKGIAYQRLAVELGKTELKTQGFEFWRQGLRSVAGRGGSEQAGADYMVLESLRQLFLDGQYYAAAAQLAWAQKFRWSPETEERLGYLMGEAHYRLGLYEDAHAIFLAYVKARREVPLSAAFDRRLLPLAAFRVGDCELRQNHSKQAFEDYSRAFTMIPTLQKLSFEGNWFPAEINRYPQVFFHRAEAQIREGNIPGALSDLRAFVNFASDHPNLGLILYRIADLLELVGGPPEKVEGAWRECIFRTGETVGGKLCLARKSRRSITSGNRAAWPRLVADVEDVLLNKNIEAFEPSFGNDLKLYAKLLLMDAFLKAGDPFQAHQQVEKSRGLAGSADLLAWIQEYRVSTLAGYLDEKVEAGKSSEVMSLLDKDRLAPGLDAGRPEIIWPQARAYKDLGLWKRSEEDIDRGLKADAENRPYEDRPSLPSRDEWKKLRSAGELNLFLAGDLAADQVEKHLREIKAGPKDPEILRMWRDFYKIVKNPSKEADTFASLKKVAALSRDEWKRYFETLAETKNDKQLRSELESYVGPWLQDASGKGVSDRPSAEIFFMLFEAREKGGDVAGAATVLTSLLARTDSLGTITKDQLFYRQGQLRRKEGKIQEARQSFESAKALAPDSMWGRLSASEMQSL